MNTPGWRFGAPYAPDGWVDPADERAQQVALITPWLDCQADEYSTLAAHLDQGDEIHEPVTFGWIPTEYQVGAAIAIANMQAIAQVEAPVQTRNPTLAQLTQSLYQQSAALWAELSVADTEGW